MTTARCIGLFSLPTLTLRCACAFLTACNSHFFSTVEGNSAAVAVDSTNKPLLFNKKPRNFWFSFQTKPMIAPGELKPHQPHLPGCVCAACAKEVFAEQSGGFRSCPVCRTETWRDFWVTWPARGSRNTGVVQWFLIWCLRRLSWFLVVDNFELIV